MDYKALADLVLPGVEGTVAQLEARFPARALPEGAKVTRMAPSPTGFMHLGNLYGALADERLAHQSDGVFLLRIEDTDQKREVPGGVEKILAVFAEYGLPFDEGVTVAGESGAYGPYRQRQRADIYAICARQLVLEGKAYPCFLTEQDLAEMHNTQEASKDNFGCYGSYARDRDLPLDEIRARIQAGQSYAIRYLSQGDAARRTKVNDLIRGTLELPENEQDVVLLKSDGIPTYHFAHVVDDHLMRVTHVVRGEEWLATLPIHIQLFAAMGWKPPKYMHTAHLMKMDGGSKRKLSKRKDPELALDYYNTAGYSVAALKEYLMTLLNSNYEDWRAANPDAPLEDFPFSIKKMGVSGALFDMDKLNDVSRTVVSRMDAETVYAQSVLWADACAPDFAAVYTREPAYTKAALSIGRSGPKRRKDITTWADLPDYLSFFYDELFCPGREYPASVSDAVRRDILSQYAQSYAPSASQQEWFDGVKALARAVGFADDMKAYKQNPAAYPGHVGDVSMVLRVAITGRTNSPDLYEVMEILGTERVRQRLLAAAQ